MMNEFKLLRHQGFNNMTKETVDALMPLWLQNIKRPTLKAASYDRLESTINNHIPPALGSYAVTQLATETIQVELINKMQADALSYSSVKKAYDALNDFLRYLTARRTIMYNPMQLVSKPTKVNFETADVVPLSDEDVRKLIDGCRLEYKTKNRRYPMGEAFILILNTGMRMGEALALRWGDVDMEKGTLCINKNLILVKNRKDGEPNYILKVQNNPKTQSGVRIVRLNEAAKSAVPAPNRTAGQRILGRG
ncbi:MAG: tyrosine-type recombinase/integrase [Clostridia bacterium]|nr:tyrosine-type recombinase/integrase [Clostridia bacterium]